MPLAALLIAGETSLPRLLGADPVEFQLRRAYAAGAGHAVIYAERATSSLLLTVDRLRRDGLSVDIARSAADVAEYIHPDEAVLMVAPDVVIDSERMAAVANSVEPVLLCVRDEPANDRFELIDPTARWTGIARIDGGLLRRTAAMVGDWDFGSTLMRRAVQEGAGRITLMPDEAGADILVLDSVAAVRAAECRLIAVSSIDNAGWATHWIIAPASRVLARVTSDLGLEPQWTTLAGLALCGLAVACSLGGWIVASLLLLLTGLLCDTAGGIGSRVGAGTARWDKFGFAVRTTAAIVVIVAMGITLTLRVGQWGCLVLSLVIVGSTWLAAPLDREDRHSASWRSDPAGHAVIGLIGFAVGAPIAALAISAIYASVSLAWLWRKAVSGLARS